MVKRILLIIMLIVLSFSLISCQAVAGLGGDIKWTADTAADFLEGD